MSAPASPPDFPIVIFHNPDCGTSRNVVAMVQAAGYAPTIVEYLQTGWSQEQLLGLAARTGLGLKALLRTKGTPAEALGLLADDVTAAQMVEAMLAYPILVNRPLVETPKGVKLCRPSEVVFDLLERRPDVFVKEDGEIVRA